MRMLSRVWGLEQIRMKYIKLLIALTVVYHAKKKKKKIKRVHHSGCQYKSVDPKRQTNDDSKVHTVTPSLAESKTTAGVLKGRYKDCNISKES